MKIMNFYLLNIQQTLLDIQQMPLPQQCFLMAIKYNNLVITASYTKSKKHGIEIALQCSTINDFMISISQ